MGGECGHRELARRTAGNRRRLHRVLVDATPLPGRATPRSRNGKTISDIPTHQCRVRRTPGHTSPYGLRSILPPPLRGITHEEDKKKITKGGKKQKTVCMLCLDDKHKGDGARSLQPDLKAGDVYEDATRAKKRVLLLELILLASVGRTVMASC